MNTEESQKAKHFKFKEVISLIQASNESIENHSIFSKACYANKNYIALLYASSFENIEKKIQCMNEDLQDNMFSLSGLYQGAYYSYTAKLYAMIKETISFTCGGSLVYSTAELQELLDKYNMNSLVSGINKVTILT